MTSFHGQPLYTDRLGPAVDPERAAPEQSSLDTVPLDTVAMVVAYEGSAFQGWQIQQTVPTVEGRLSDALSVILRSPSRVYGSGRTDAGVHALNQVAHFRLPAGMDLESMDLEKVRKSLNGLAGPNITVKRLIRVSPAFHARHSAIGKTYRYHLFNRAYPPAFGRQHCWWIKYPLDVQAMRRAATALLGTHDFSAFRAADCAAASPVRSLNRVELEEGDWMDSTLRIELEGSGFLQHMARIITGTLVAVGLGRLSPQAMESILHSRRRQLADATAPGRGLHLVRVAYDLSRFPELRALEGA